MFCLTDDAPGCAVSTEYTGSVTGRMRLPEYDASFQRPTESPVLSAHNLRSGWDVAEGVEVYGAVRTGAPPAAGR